MKIVFMGTPNFSVPILEALIEKYDVSLVVTQPDKEVGRKRILTPTPVKECALKHNISVFQPVKIRDDYQKVVDEKPDMVITAAFGQFIPDEVINCARLGAINVHGSLLPKYRGGSPVQTSIINGDLKTGITIMYMVKKMDAGDIITQRSVDILDSDNNETLFEKLSYVGRDLLLETIPSIVDGTNPRISQDEDKVTFAYNITHEEQFINWNKTSREIFNLVRGLNPNPTALTSINGNLFKVYNTECINYQGHEEAGTILNLTKQILIKTSDGAIKITEIQQSGKNRMDAKSFLNGQKVLNLGDKFSNDVI